MSDGDNRHGNYHGYYSKRPSQKDPRLALLPPTFFAGKTVLDVGCNEGRVTCEIAHAWSPRRVLGVDVDDTLVRAAWKRRRTLWSLQSPHPASPPEPDYFPLSCEHTHGPLPIPTAPVGHDRETFPHNVAFRTADWVAEDTTADEPTYDVVIAFSITKWIHLNYGDQGIATFFRRAHSVLKPGGAFVVEPQAWETYTKARRRHPRLRENARHLRLRPQDFPKLLEELEFAPPQHLGTTGVGGFHRPVDLYIKK